MSLATSLPIADKLARGLLPAADPLKTYAGHGNGRPCDGCNLPISTTEIEHEMDFADGLTVRFHAGCAATWHSLVASGRAA